MLSKTANLCAAKGCRACLSSDPSKEARFRNAKALKKNTCQGPRFYR